jgi:hypothetical protein
VRSIDANAAANPGPGAIDANDANDANPSGNPPRSFTCSILGERHPDSTSDTPKAAELLWNPLTG